MLTRSVAMQQQGALLKEQAKALTDARKEFSDKVKQPRCEKAKIEQYTLLKCIGEGGFGSVYKATNESGEVVAVKVQSKEELRDTALGTTMAINERIYLSGCQSNFIVKCLGSWRSASFVVLVMDYSPYGDLWARITEAPFTEKSARYFLAQIVCALEYIHAINVIHGDMKPDNCLVYKKGRLKIGGFGLARYRVDNLIATGGSVHYMAPEAFGNAFYGPLVDWWAFGITMHVMLLRTYPFSEPGDRMTVATRFQAPDPLPVPTVDGSTLTAEAKDLLRCLFVKDLTKRLGRSGADEVKKHLWFSAYQIDFAWIRSDDFLCPDFNLEEVTGTDCEPDLLKQDGPESGDPRADEFKDF